jgi:hypothetical protein
MSGCYIPEYVYGAIHDDNGRWTGECGLVPWPAHLRPRDASAPEEATQPAPEAPTTLVNAGGVFFVTLSPDDRAGIATTIERLINMLDDIDGDETLEDGGDLEPNLGWVSGERFSEGFRDTDEREVEDEHGGDINDLPHDDDELEPFLGWSERWGNGKPLGPVPVSGVLMDDPEAGDSALYFRGDGYRQARAALRTRRVAQFPREYVERVTIIPDGEPFRTFMPIRRARS